MSQRAVQACCAEAPITRLALCLTPPPLAGDRGADSFLAAVVEHHLAKDKLPIPEWTSDPRRYCDPPWDVAGIDSLADDVRRSTPSAFRAHGVLITEDDLGTSVDVVPADALKTPVREEALAEAVTL